MLRARPRLLLTRLAGLLWLVALVWPGLASGLESVRLQLKWRHQFQFAGYYAALEQGYFRDAGLDVQLLEGAPGLNPADVVLSGQAEYGVSASELVMLAAQGKPVVLLAPIFQHSAPVLLVRASGDIASARDLVGRRVSIEPRAVELLAWLRREGVDLDKTIQVPHTGTLDKFLAGEVDAQSVYGTVEPYLVRESGVACHTLDPGMGGIDFYGDTLFTTQQEIAQHPERTAKLRAAVVRGWAWALAHQRDVVELIWLRYSQRHSKEHLTFEAREIRKLVMPDIVELGYLNPERIEHIASVYAELGLMPANRHDLRPHLYLPKPDGIDPRYLWALAGSLLLLVGVGTAGWRYRRVAQRLRAAEATLRQLALTDVLTGLPNRRAGFERLQAECAQALRHGRRLSIALVDVDHFKRVNDRWGHPGGDAVLREVAKRLQHGIRNSDLAARWGGEEFLLILHATDAAGAGVSAERVRASAAAAPVPLDADQVEITVSIGTASLPADLDAGPSAASEVADDLLQRADLALYRAKNAGRNRVEQA